MVLDCGDGIADSGNVRVVDEIHHLLSVLVERGLDRAERLVPCNHVLHVGNVHAECFSEINFQLHVGTEDVAAVILIVLVALRCVTVDTIKRITGKSASTHINRCAAAIIRDYLQTSTLSITQIVDEMNFSSVSYFSRYCTKHLGMSPAAYRVSTGRRNRKP